MSWWDVHITPEPECVTKAKSIESAKYRLMQSDWVEWNRKRELKKGNKEDSK